LDPMETGACSIGGIEKANQLYESWTPIE